MLFAKLQSVEMPYNSLFKVESNSSLSTIIANFKESVRSLMVKETKDERIDFIQEGDQLNAALKVNGDVFINSFKLYFILMKPSLNYSYNSNKLRLGSPTRIPHLRSLSIPGVKLTKKEYNPTTIKLDKRFHDIFEIMPSREMDYVMSDNMIVCDTHSIPKDSRVFIIKQYKYQS